MKVMPCLLLRSCFRRVKKGQCRYNYSVFIRNKIENCTCLQFVTFAVKIDRNNIYKTFCAQQFFSFVSIFFLLSRDQILV